MFQWIGKNVSFDKLKSSIQKFLAENNFKVVVKNIENGYNVLATSNFYIEKSKLSIIIRLSGDSKNFTISFDPSVGRTHRIWDTSTLTSLFGGSLFIRRDLRAKEHVERLERKFWDYMNLVIADLSGSSPSHS